MRALVRVDRLEIQHMANHMELVDDSVAAVHVSRRASDVERFSAAVAFEDRGDFGRRLAFILQAAKPQARLKPKRDLGLHVGEFFLNELIGGERLSELLAIE